jgi:hypothetical protein
MTVRVEVDLNVRVPGGQTFAGFEDVNPATITRARASDADGPVSAGDKVLVVEPSDAIIGDALVVGERVIAYEGESGLAGDAVVTEIDPARRLIYLAVDWHSFRDDTPERRG